VGATVISFNIEPGFYTISEVLDQLVEALNTFTAGPSATGLTWSVVALTGAGAALTATGAPGIAFLVTGTLPLQLYSNGFIGVIPAGGSTQFDILASVADLRPARYVDIVCNQLTNNQSVKDASTAESVRDVLVRWYFDYDNQNPTDDFGFPILMGYTAFCLRRLYNPPKQIQWQTNIPVGNLTFQLYGADGKIQPVNANTNFLMTLQISEN